MQEKIPEKPRSSLLPNLDFMKRNSSLYVAPRHSFLKISPMKVPLIKGNSDFLSYNHKPVNSDIFPLKGFKRLIEAPVKYINPFYQGELLLQCIVKIEKSFFTMGVYFEPKLDVPDNFRIFHLSDSNQASEFLLKRIQDWEVLIKLSQIREKQKFIEEIRLGFNQFLMIFLEKKEDYWRKILKFLYNRGFSPEDQKVILHKSLSIFKLDKCRILLRDSNEKRSTINALNSFRFGSLPSVQYSISLRDFPSETFNSLTHVIPTEEHSSPCLKLQDSSYKKPNNYIVTFGDSIKILNHYNTIKFLNRVNYYIRINLPNKTKFIRLSFINPENGKNHIKISYYEPMNAIREYCYVTNEKDIEKVINVLQISGEKVKRNILNMYLNIRNDLVGRKLFFFKEWPVRKSSSSPNNQSPIIKTNFQPLKLIAVSLNNDPFLKTFYETKTFFEPFRLDVLGKCYVKIMYYKPNEKFMSNQDVLNKVFFKFEFFPYSSKTKRFKFLLSYFDIRELLQISLRFENERVLMISLNRLILKRIRVIKCELYHSLTIPAQEFAFNNKKFLHYRMKFRKLAYEDKETVSFLIREFVSYRTIFHIVKKIQGEFCIISVQRHNFLQHWVLNIYVMKSNRRFVCYITNDDIIRMNSDFLENLYPFEMESLNKIFAHSSNSIHYNEFSEKYRSSRTGLANLNSNEANSKSEPSLKKKHPFIEMKFWEDLLSNMQLSLNNNGKLRLKINTFKGIIREYLFHDILQKGNPDSLIFLEVFFENRKSKTPINIFNKLPNLTYHSANHYNIYIRLTNLHHLNITNEKFTLRDMIYSYSLDPVNLLDTSKLAKTIYSQAELKNFCNFLKFKLQSRDFNMNLLEIVEYPNKSKNNNVIKKDLTGKALKRLNCSIGLQNIHFNKEKKYVLIYKAVFTLRPLKMVTVSFCIHKLIFYVEVYNIKSCQTYSKKIPMFVVKNYIPFIKEMLLWSLFHLIGVRIVQIFKNSLIVESYIKSK